MECTFCRGPVEVTTGRCQHCGQPQPILSAPTLIREIPEANRAPRRCPGCGLANPTTARMCLHCAHPFQPFLGSRTPDRAGEVGLFPAEAMPIVSATASDEHRDALPVPGGPTGSHTGGLMVPIAPAYPQIGQVSGSSGVQRGSESLLSAAPPASGGSPSPDLATPPFSPGYPAPSSAPVRPKKGGLSRRTVLVGLAGLALTGSGVAWYTLTRRTGQNGVPAATSFTQTSAPRKTPRPTATPLGTTLLTYHGHVSGVTAVAWAPNGTLLASGGGTGDDTVQVWEAATGTRVATAKADSVGVLALAWSSDTTRLASAAGSDYGGERTNDVQLWNALTGALLRTYHQSQQSENVNDVSWSPDSKTVASASDDGTYNIWDPATGRTLASYAGQFQYATAIAWSPDGKRLAVGTSESQILIVNPTTGIPLVTISGSGGSLRKLSWSPDGQRIVAADYSRQIHLWDTVTGDLVLSYGGHSASATTVAWSPDSRRIASAGDTTVQLWDPLTGRTLFTYLGHPQGATDLAWSPDGTRVASSGGYHDDMVQIWQAV